MPHWALEALSFLQAGPTLQLACSKSLKSCRARGSGVSDLGRAMLDYDCPSVPERGRLDKYPKDRGASSRSKRSQRSASCVQGSSTFEKAAARRSLGCEESSLREVPVLTEEPVSHSLESQAPLFFEATFTFSQWAQALPRLLSRTRTSFSRFLCKTFCLCRDETLSVSTAVSLGPSFVMGFL